MPTLSLCPECGAEIAVASSRGLCTRCLFGLGLGGGDGVDEAANAAPSRGESEIIPGFTPARRLGDYELLEEIARGGMGVVYRARQISLDRIVAVKLILSGQFASREQALRFRVEAEAAAKLQHPNIVAIHETGEHEGQPYFSMDHVAGGSLASLARQQPLAAKRAAALVKTVAEAIHYAHDQGVLHRDLKPTNILLDAAGQPRVTDFGLARRFERDSFLTVTGQVLGSPSFMPPEQAGARSVKAGRYSDVYSLGSILFYLVTGRPPFVSESVPETLRQVLHNEPVSPRLLNPAMPADLATICLKCLEKEPAKRYATARLLAEDLDRFLQGQPIAARPVGYAEKLWRWCRREPVVAGLGGASLLLAILLGLGGPVLAYRAREEAFRARQNLYAADIGTAQQAINEGDLGRARDRLTPHIPGQAEKDLRGFEWHYLWSRLHGDAAATFTTNEPPRRHLAISPDGRLLAAGNQLWATDSPQVVEQLGEKSEALAFTRDGAALLLNRNGNFCRRDLRTREEFVLLEQESAEAIAVSASGEWLAAGTRRGLRLFELPGGQLAGSCTNVPFDAWSALDPAHAPFHFFSAKGLAFAPDGRRLLAASGHPMDHMSRLSCWSIPTLLPVPVPENSFANDASGVLFAPSGREFVTAHWDGHLAVWDATTMTEIRSRRRPGAHHGWIGDMAFIPGGSKLVTAGADRCVRVWESGTWEPSLTLRGHEGEIWALAPSPDGRFIHTAACDGRLNQWLPAPPVPDDAPISRLGSPLLPAGISPDGRVLATVSEQAVRFWLIHERAIREETASRVDLGNPGQHPQNWDPSASMVAVSPDSRWLAISRPDKLVELVSLGLARNSRQLAEIPAGRARLGFSPDGRLLACAGGNGKIEIIELATGRKTATLATPGETDVVFPFFFASRANILAVAGTRSVLLWDTVARRVTREIKAVDSGLFVSFAISADASLLAMGYTDNHFTLHDCRTGAQLDRVSSHISGVDWLSFSPDGKTLATASGRWVRLWDLRTRREMLPLEHAAKVIYLAFTPDGNALLTAEMGGVTRVWRAPPSPGK